MKDKVVFHNRYLHSGTHTFQYYAYVVTSGKFVVPPAKAFVREQPEVMGLSESFEFIVD